MDILDPVSWLFSVAVGSEGAGWHVSVQASFVLSAGAHRRMRRVWQCANEAVLGTGRYWRRLSRPRVRLLDSGVVHGGSVVSACREAAVV